MAIQLGDTAPDFTQQSTAGQIRFHEYLGDSWGVLFSHPKAFTPVCTTELGMVARLKPEFDKRHCKVLGLAVDPLSDDLEWIKDIQETQGVEVNFPIISDADRSVCSLYGMIHPNASDSMTVRSVFIIDPAKKVRLMIIYPASTGRNFDEILRVIDSLQLTSSYRVATPVNWKQGQDCIVVPSLSDDEVSKLFPKGFRKIKPYLRLTPQPNQ